MWSYYDLKRWPIIKLWPWQRSPKNSVIDLDGYASEIEIAKALPRQFFKTKRLQFRPLELSDLYPMLDIVSKEDVARFVDDGEPMDEDLVERWIHFSRRRVAHYGSGTGALVHRRTGKLIGWAGLSRPENEPPEIVYGLDSTEWGKGYGYEIARALTLWCEKDLRLNHVRATVYAENHGSVRILEKLGFEHVKDLYNDHGYPYRLYVRAR